MQTPNYVWAHTSFWSVLHNSYCKSNIKTEFSHSFLYWRLVLYWSSWFRLWDPSSLRPFNLCFALFWNSASEIQRLAKGFLHLTFVDSNRSGGPFVSHLREGENCGSKIFRLNYNFIPKLWGLYLIVYLVPRLSKEVKIFNFVSNWSLTFNCVYGP